MEKKWLFTWLTLVAIILVIGLMSYYLIDIKSDIKELQKTLTAVNKDSETSIEKYMEEVETNYNTVSTLAEKNKERVIRIENESLATLKEEIEKLKLEIEKLNNNKLDNGSVVSITAKDSGKVFDVVKATDLLKKVGISESLINISSFFFKDPSTIMHNDWDGSDRQQFILKAVE